jgi:hypothetical protein
MNNSLSSHSHIEVLQLKDTDFIAKGGRNLVYRHPTNPSYLVKLLGVVKVLGLAQQAEVIKGLEHRLNNSMWIGSSWLMRTINRFRLSKAHVREFIEVVRMRFHDEFLLQPPPFMQQVIGFVDTNLGFAKVVVAEKDREGNYAPTLKTLINNNQMNAQMRAQLDLFFEQILTYDLIVSDLRAKNIVYAYHEKHGDRFVLIDGAGDKNIIPVLRLSHYLRKRAKNRMIKKLKARL